MKFQWAPPPSGSVFKGVLMGQHKNSRFWAKEALLGQSTAKVNDGTKREVDRLVCSSVPLQEKERVTAQAKKVLATCRAAGNHLPKQAGRKWATSMRMQQPGRADGQRGCSPQLPDCVTE